MKKYILFLFLMILNISCSNTKSAINGWVGKSKQNLIKSLGTPVRTFNTDKDGEILIYADQIYANSDNVNGSRIAGPNYWSYMYVYVDNAGKIYSCKNEKQKFPPQEIVIKN